MKNITHLDDFQPLYEKTTPEKAKFYFDISANNKKASKIQKTLIDVHQLLMEMSDEIVALKLNYSHLDADSEVALNDMKTNIDNMVTALKGDSKYGEGSGEDVEIGDTWSRNDKNGNEQSVEILDVNGDSAHVRNVETQSEYSVPLKSLIAKQGSHSGMIGNCGSLVGNLEKLKHGFLVKKSSK